MRIKCKYCKKIIIIETLGSMVVYDRDKIVFHCPDVACNATLIFDNIYLRK